MVSYLASPLCGHYGTMASSPLSFDPSVRRTEWKWVFIWLGISGWVLALLSFPGSGQSAMCMFTLPVLSPVSRAALLTCVLG